MAVTAILGMVGMNTASDSAASSARRALDKLFHTVTTDDAGGSGSNTAATVRVEPSGSNKSNVNLPHIPSPLRTPAQDASYWKQSGLAFRVDRGHILSSGQAATPVAVNAPAMPAQTEQPAAALVAAAAIAPPTIRNDQASVPVARPISPGEISPRSLPAQTPESPQIEQIAEYLRRRQTEIANQHKDLAQIARQHQTQLQQQHELRQQRAELSRRKLELGVENLRLRLLALGEQLSQQIANTSPLFMAFEETCETFHQLKSSLRELKS